MKALPWKSNWNAGELSPRMEGRVDQAKYGSGSSVLQNFIPTVQGPVIKRGGTYYINHTKNGANRSWLLRFLYNVTSSYTLEFGDRYVRFFTNGGIVTEPANAIGGITQASPGVVTDDNHGYSSGDEIYVSAIVGMTQLNGNFYLVVKIDSDTYSLTDYDGNAINTTGYGAYVSGGVTERIYTLPTPYAVADLTDSGGNCRLKYVQSEEVLYLTHPEYPMQKLSRLGNADWTIAPVNLAKGPFQTINTVQTSLVYLGPGINFSVSGAASNGTPNLIRVAVASTTGLATGMSVEIYGVAGTVEANGQWIITLIDSTHFDLQGSVFANAYSSGGQVYGRNGCPVTVIANNNLFAATDVGSVFYIEAPLTDNYPQWQPAVAVSSGQRYQSGLNTYISLNAATTGTETPVHTQGAVYDGSGSGGVQWLFEDSGSGVIAIAAYDSPTQVTGFLNVPPPYANYGAANGSFFWAYGLFSETNGYPEVCTFFRDRLTLSKGIQLAGSVASDYENFAPMIAGQVTPDSGYVITIPASNGIVWMSPGNDLLIGTGGEEVMVTEIDATQAFGPSNVKARTQTSHGGRLVDAIPVEYITFFVTVNGQQLRQVIYSWMINGYMAEDMTVLADHIPKGPDGKQGITQMAWAQQPDMVLYSSTTDGRLAGFTYNRDQQVFGWHNHPLGGSYNGNQFGNANVESIVVIPRSDGTVDDLWLQVARTINGVTRRYIEVMQPYFTDVNANIANAYYVDCGLTYNGAASQVIQGYAHLSGQMVDVLADGGAHPQVRVAFDGSITLQYPASVVQAGLPCPSKMRTMRIEAGSQIGSSQASIKRIVRIAIRFLNTICCKFGPCDSILDDIPWRMPQDDMDTPPPLFSGDKYPLDFPGGYDSDAYIEMVQDKPLPMTIAGLRADVETYETVQ